MTQNSEHYPKKSRRDEIIIAKQSNPTKRTLYMVSPLLCKTFLLVVTGTGLLPYIRPLNERVFEVGYSKGIRTFRAMMNSARIILIEGTVLVYLGVLQVFDTPV